jgi:hypothetical protein
MSSIPLWQREPQVGSIYVDDWGQRWYVGVDQLRVPNDVVIRDQLKQTPKDLVHMKCFNKAEADEIAALLTPTELKRVTFSWMFT